MLISLKRALKLRKELEAIFARIELPTTTTVSLLVDFDPETSISAGFDALTKRVTEMVHLSEILADLRLKITKANVENDIESALAKAAHATRAMAIYKKLATAAAIPPADQLKAEVDLSAQSLQNPNPSGYSRPERSITVSTVTPERKAQAAEDYIWYKRSLETLEDYRTGKNASVQIEIAENDAELLRQQGLI